MEELKLTNFKNLKTKNFKFSKGVNCFVGNNGAGKTNILDAIHYLSLTKSYLNLIDSQNICFGESFFNIQGIFCTNNNERTTILCGLKEGEKKIIKKDYKSYKKLSDHIGKFPIVIISPYDQDLINGVSEIRRKQINRVLSQLNKEYYFLIKRHKRCIQQRNSLLKRFASNHYFDRSNLEIYDTELSSLANKIYELRNKFIVDYNILFKNYYNKISNDKEKTSIEYQSELHNKPMEELLRDNLQKDRILQYTSSGIHRDELIFLINDKPIRKFGSQGQQKTFLISLKMAEFILVENNIDIKPLLLLDDIFDKLDTVRVEQLINLVNRDSFSQIFITDTHKDRIENLIKNIMGNHRVFSL